ALTWRTCSVCPAATTLFSLVKPPPSTEYSPPLTLTGAEVWMPLTEMGESIAQLTALRRGGVTRGGHHQAAAGNSATNRIADLVIGINRRCGADIDHLNVIFAKTE
ncbi:MAG: hypothetical protein P8166_13205, partial [Candidatus Thiodiazotropha sp.]